MDFLPSIIQTFGRGFESHSSRSWEDSSVGRAKVLTRESDYYS
jgi:hypothetical protein